jgi:hypothetical protein
MLALFCGNPLTLASGQIGQALLQIAGTPGREKVPLANDMNLRIKSNHPNM